MKSLATAVAPLYTAVYDTDKMSPHLLRNKLSTNPPNLCLNRKTRWEKEQPTEFVFSQLAASFFHRKKKISVRLGLLMFVDYIDGGLKCIEK